MLQMVAVKCIRNWIAIFSHLLIHTSTFVMNKSKLAMNFLVFVIFTGS